MAVSLNNKRNTKIVTEGNTTKLIHHGKTTCIITDEGNGYTLTINTCGYDTLTTRGKINKFLDAYAPNTYALIRRKGETFLASWAPSHGWHHKPNQTPLNGATTIWF